MFLVRRSLVGNFPRRKTTRECVSLAAPRRAKKLSHSYPRLLLRPLPVILTVLYLREVTFVKRALPLTVRGTTPVSVVCDDGRFIFPKESRACEAPDRGRELERRSVLILECLRPYGHPSYASGGVCGRLPQEVYSR